jgi:hypothetical protein
MPEKEGPQPVDPSTLPEGLTSDPDFFDISKTQLLVDESTVVSGYAGSGPDLHHAEDMIPTVFLRVDGRLNGTNGNELMNVTLVLSPDAAVSIARSLIHAISHFPKEHVGIDVEEMLAMSEEEYHRKFNHTDEPEQPHNSHWADTSFEG